MRDLGRRGIIQILCFLVAVSLFGCEKPKQGKVIISQQDFSMRQDNKYNWEIDARGTVKNIGDVDVKNIVVTGYCESCGEALLRGVWFVSNVDKMHHQKATIAYLPAGSEREFSFKEVAFMMLQEGKKPEKMPEKLRCKILSFETVQK